MPYLKKKRYGGFSKRGTFSRRSNKTWKKKSTWKKPRAKRVSKFKRSQLNFKRLMKPHIVKSPPSGASNSKVVIRYSRSTMSKYAKFITQPSIYEFCGAGSLTSLMSGQGVASIIGGFVGSSVNINKNFDTLFNRMTIKDNTGNQIIPNLNSNGQASYKVYLDSETRETTFANFSPMPITLTIWNLVANCDQTTQGAGPAFAWHDPLTAWNDGLLKQLGGTADQDGGYGGTAGPYFPNYNFPGADPRDAKNFNHFWKVQKKTIVTLGPGRGHNHLFHFKPQTIIDTNAFVYPNVAKKGLTTATMYAAIGGLSSSTNVGSPDTTTYGIAKVGIITKYKWVTRLLETQPRSTYQDNNISTTAGNNYIQRESSGAVSGKATDPNFG